MHNRIFCLLGIGCIAFATLGFRFDSVVALWSILMAVCFVGVPHGGLDHIKGRKQLEARWGNFWSIPFFTVYLLISVATVVGWLMNPILTAIAFFLASAIHFGREDQLMSQPPCLRRVILDAASGGLVIWIPAVARPAEFQQILASIIPTAFASSIDMVVYLTSGLAIALVPIALSEIAYNGFSPTALKLGGRLRSIRQIVMIVLFASTPILVAFTVYFCAWHSILGLKHLMQENHMRLGELLVATMPMSVGAVVLIGLGMWFWNSGRELSEELTRTLFIGLSALAVPHLVLNAIPTASSYRHPSSAPEFRGVE